MANRRKILLFIYSIILNLIVDAHLNFIHAQPTKLSTGFYLPSKDLGGHYQFGCVKWICIAYDSQSRCVKWKCINYHLAVDRKCDEGDPVYAVADGKVISKSNNVCGFLAMDPYLRGPAMMIRHKNDQGKIFYALYGHIKDIKKETDSWVYAGEHIANVGPCYRYKYEGEIKGKIEGIDYYKVIGKNCNNEDVTYLYKEYIPHLHFGINTGENPPDGPYDSSSTGYWVDPIDYLNNNRPYFGIILKNQAVAPTEAYPGNILTFYYWIENPETQSKNVSLKAKIIKGKTQEVYNDPSNELIIVVEPGKPDPNCSHCKCDYAGGYANCYYTRKFKLPDNIEAGKYDVEWEIVDNSSPSKYYKEKKKEFIKIIPLSNTRSGDLNRDGRVNMQDASILMSYWGATNRPPADLNQDGIVDLKDVSIMLSNWYNP